MTAAAARPLTTGARVRRWLAVDAVVTGANAVAYLAVAGWLTQHLGSEAGALRGVGGYLLAFTGLVVLALLTRSRPLAVAVVVGNVLWLVASVVVGAAGLLDVTGLGRGWVVLQGVVVGVLALLQARALQAEAD